MSNTTTTTTTPRRNNVITKGCDICLGKNQCAGMPLWSCRTCHIHIHPLCYGLEKAEESNFECWACRAVGTEIHGRDLKTGQMKKFNVTARPTECCLCGVDNGTEFLHAMHPVYDYHGGYHIILPATKEGPERLAWAHSLCCFALCSHDQTSGCLYGCTMKGSYEGVTHPEEKERKNPNFPFNIPHLGKNSIHHFAYWGIRRHEKEDLWTRTLREHKQLKCRLCGKDDRPAHVLRIPVQCSANSTNEFSEFKGRHEHLRDDHCYEAIHVGCAIWKKDDTGAWPSRRRVYFHPGRSEGTVQIGPVINVFCTTHAEDLCGVGGSRLLRYPVPENLGRSASVGAVPPSHRVPPEKPHVITGRSVSAGTVPLSHRIPPEKPQMITGRSASAGTMPSSSKVPLEKTQANAGKFASAGTVAPLHKGFPEKTQISGRSSSFGTGASTHKAPPEKQQMITGRSASIATVPKSSPLLQRVPSNKPLVITGRSASAGTEPTSSLPSQRVPPEKLTTRSASVGTLPRSSSLSQKPILQPPNDTPIGEVHKGSSSVFPKSSSSDQDRSVIRLSSSQGPPGLFHITRKTTDKSVTGPSSSMDKAPTGLEQPIGDGSYLNRAEAPNKVPVPADLTAEKAFGTIPRKAAVAQISFLDGKSQKTTSLSLPAVPKRKKTSSSDPPTDTGLDHVPRKRPAVPPPASELKKKPKLSSQAKPVKDIGKKKAGGSAQRKDDVADTNQLSAEATLKSSKKKKVTGSAPEGKKKKLGKKIVVEPAAPSKPVSVPPSLKRSITESKCHSYDDTELERKYLKILESLKEVVEKFVYSEETFKEVMNDERPNWEKEINTRRPVFNALWSKVEKAVSKNVHFSGEDWSFLVVGKNFDLGKMDFSQWESYEVIKDDNDEMSV
ncbi:hypothetical protein FisN_27Lh035 [Fistulifera solaris]|uniref:PHD-type domain-containing protein n=1 Tax=Fistulifera solaris TaxID=1519565 RepID=A0A1Z5JHQ0_FISSO|nr:hypothetical protein FisN_27Lh035 [Fistulifera solaris]|eukprot:GAX13524.1 hypothetical protein FisN_27Lh035 [Fistulifera solaris]